MQTNNNARGTLTSLVEEHLTTLIREANVIKRHSKRARLHLLPGGQTSSNTKGGVAGGGDGGGGSSNNTGTSNSNTVVRRRLHAEDINLALQWRGSEKLYATGTVVPPDPTTNNNSSSNSNNNTVDLEDYLKTEMQLRPPLEVALTSHWLAVDGQQPDLPQNPPPPAGGSSSSSTKGKGSSSSSSGANVIENDNTALLDNQQDNASGGAGGSTTSSSGVRVSQLLPLLLSEELQLYFSRITLAIQRGGATPTTRQQQDAALASISRDVGLQELLPFFIKYISQELQHHVGNPDHCRTLVRLALSLLQNPHLHLELHLHQLLPALMTCVVANKLSSRPTDNHWALRREAAQTLIRACNLFGEEYATLKARVLRTLCDATSPDKPLTTQYGGIVAISLFGSKAIDAFLLPVVPMYWQQWDKELASSTDMVHRTELLMCQQAVLNALGVFLRRVNSVEQSSQISWGELEETFGDLLIPLIGDETEYSGCIV